MVNWQKVAAIILRSFTTKIKSEFNHDTYDQNIYEKIIIQINLLDATIMLLKMSCMNQCHLKIVTNVTAMLIISFLPARWASTLN